MVGTSRLRDLYEKFEEELGKRQAKAKAARPLWEPPKTKLDEDIGECLMGKTYVLQEDTFYFLEGVSKFSFRASNPVLSVQFFNLFLCCGKLE